MKYLAILVVFVCGFLAGNFDSDNVEGHISHVCPIDTCYEATYVVCDTVQEVQIMDNTLVEISNMTLQDREYEMYCGQWLYERGYTNRYDDVMEFCNDNELTLLDFHKMMKHRLVDSYLGEVAEKWGEIINNQHS